MTSKEKDIIEIGEGWACALRTLKDAPAVYCYYNQKLVTKLPISLIVQCVPFNHTITQETKKEVHAAFATHKVPEPKNLQRVAVLLHQNLSKATQPTNAYIVKTEEDAPSLAVATGGNSRHTYEDAELANMLATAEASQNLAATGATPIAFFKLPQNADSHQPTLGLLGLLPKEMPQTSLAFVHKGEMIYLLGRSVEDIASSEYLYSFHHIHPSPAPQMNPQEQSRLQTVLVEAIRKNLVTSINSITRGGLFFALLASSMPNRLGFDITSDAEIREDAFLFGESLGRFIVSVSEENDSAFVDLMTRNKVPVTTLGHTTKGEIRIDDLSYGFIHDYE